MVADNPNIKIPKPLSTKVGFFYKHGKFNDWYLKKYKKEFDLKELDGSSRRIDQCLDVWIELLTEYVEDSLEEIKNVIDNSIRSFRA